MVVAPLSGLGFLYTLSAAVLGAGFIYGAVKLYRQPGTPAAQGLFRYSILYLFLLYLMMSVDALFGAASGGSERSPPEPAAASRGSRESAAANPMPRNGQAPRARALGAYLVAGAGFEPATFGL